MRNCTRHGNSDRLKSLPRPTLMLASAIVMRLQTLVSRESSPFDPSVVTVGAIHGGSKRNVIPEAVELKLTLRGYKEAVVEAAEAALRRHARGLALAAGLTEGEAPVFSIPEPAFRPVGETEFVNGVAATQYTQALVRQVSSLERTVRLYQIIPRPTGALLGLELSLHPFALNPSFRAIEPSRRSPTFSMSFRSSS